MLRAGIVGLPNVGIVSVPDARLAELKRIAKTTVVIPAAIELVDIAGLVKGASQGEGLGNKFLTHIREVDAVVRWSAVSRTRTSTTSRAPSIPCATSRSSTPS